MKQLVLLIFSAVLAGLFYLFHQLAWPTVWLGIGLAIGAAWFILDPVLLFPGYQKLADLPFPLSRSFWLLLIYWPLMLFIMTSTGSWLAQGMMLALGLGIGLELLSLLSQPLAIREIFHFPPQSTWQATELQILGAGWLVGLVMIIILFII